MLRQSFSFIFREIRHNGNGGLCHVLRRTSDMSSSVAFLRQDGSLAKTSKCFNLGYLPIRPLRLVRTKHWKALHLHIVIKYCNRINVDEHHSRWHFPFTIFLEVHLLGGPKGFLEMVLVR